MFQPSKNGGAGFLKHPQYPKDLTSKTPHLFGCFKADGLPLGAHHQQVHKLPVLDVGNAA
jgi:hypothetical protein